jgi:hypothetical protein
MVHLKPIFKVRIVYKSGYTHDFEVYSFSLAGGVYRWESVNDDNKPVELGGTEIAAVWQIGHRKVLRWGWK